MMNVTSQVNDAFGLHPATTARNRNTETPDRIEMLKPPSLSARWSTYKGRWRGWLCLYDLDSKRALSTNECLSHEPRVEILCNMGLCSN